MIHLVIQPAQLRLVTIVDTTSPSITAPSSITIEATSADSNIVALGNPVSSDLVDIPSVSNNAPDVFPLGETIVTWTAVDGSGNLEPAQPRQLL